MIPDRRVRTVVPPVETGASVTFARCTLVRLPSFVDERGSLVVTERGADLPFEVKRVFLIHAVPDGARRGGHALERSEEVLIAVHGSVTVDVDDGVTCWRIVLDDPTVALHVRTGVWCEENSFGTDGVLAVLASEIFDPDEFDPVRPGGSSDG